jgi:hypothetical protein
MIAETFSLGESPPINASAFDRPITDVGRRVASQLTCIANNWQPEYIPLSHPLMCCTLIGPGAAVVHAKSSTIWRNHEVSGLILSHSARFWTLSKVMLRELAPKRSLI